MREVFNFKILDFTVRTNQPDKIGVNSDRPAPDGVVGPVFSLHCQYILYQIGKLNHSNIIE